MQKISSLFLLLVVLILSSCTKTQEVRFLNENEAANHYTKLLSSTYGDDIQYLECFDINGDGRYACVAMVASKSDYEMYGKIVFADNEDSTEELFSSSLVDVFNFICFVKNGVLSVEEFFGGSSSLSHVWKVTETGCEKLEHNFMFLKNTSGNDYTFYESFFAPYHIYQKYYLFWDGESFKEYGAIPMSEDQFLLISGGSNVIDRIKANGATVDEILYRDNGIININYSKNDSQDNITLVYKDNAVTVDDSDELYKGSFDNIGSSYGGKYLTAAIPEIAVYPASLPF